MRPGAQTLAETWPIAATLALVLAGEKIRAGRRRSALNTAMHELRRPLQILAMAAPAPEARTRPREGASPLELTWVALAELDRQINGGRETLRPRLIPCQSALEAAAERWAGVTEVAGGQITLRARGAPVLLLADPARLGQALDNMIANALEYGGPRVEVEISLVVHRVRIAVAGSGPRAGAAAGRVEVGALIARAGGRQRRGHGLRAVAAIAARHGGRLLLTRSADGTTAVLELPLAGAASAA